MSAAVYLCIDLKSFYASVECIERGLDPMEAKLVVADPERSEKTICLAVSPALKNLGFPGRCRLFEIPKNIDFIIAPPRMQKYIDYAAEIYAIYLKYISPEDIHVYSIDEVFINAAPYLKLYRCTAREFALLLMQQISDNLGIRAACGIGSNLYLAKVALDILAKHSPDFIAFLDEENYRLKLWQHTPLTDFWRIGRGTAARLAKYGLTTMEKIAHTDEELLYRLFGIDTELLIDHAWGREPVTIRDIKNYQPKSNCLTAGQVLMRDYSFSEGKLILREMLDLLCLETVKKSLVCGSITIHITYSDKGSASGTAHFPQKTCASDVILSAVTAVYERIVPPSRTIRRVNICYNNVTRDTAVYQPSLFDTAAKDTQKSKKLSQTILAIKDKYGKDAMLRGMNFEEAATTRERNHQIGGHKSGK